jgi:restriction system protein
MTVKEAAVIVLSEAGTPLRAEEITKKLLSRGLWKTSGKTPEATVAANLYSDIKKKGEASPFRLVAPQTFDLRPGYQPEPEAHGHKSSPKKATGRTYSFTDAAEKVLEEYGGKRPMHYREITDKALENGWLATEGKTPEASMYAQIIMEIQRYQRRGEQPRFVKHGKGYVGLSRWMGRGLAFQIEEHNKKVLQTLRKRLLGMDWGDFEELVAGLLAEIGFEDIELTERRKDGGIDVRGTLVVGDVIRTRMAVQVKRWKNNVQAPVVQQVRGSLGTHEHGLIITTSDFGKGAREEAARPDATPVALMNGEQLVSLLVSYNLLATRLSHEIFELEEEEPSK